MGWFVAIPVAVGGFIVKRRVQIVAGTLVVTFLDDAGRVIGEFIGQEAADAAEKEIKDLGGSIAEDIGNATLEVVRGIGRATVEGVDAAYDAIREKFIKGKEPDIVAGFTIAMLAILTGVYVWHSVKNAKDAL